MTHVSLDLNRAELIAKCIEHITFKASYLNRPFISFEADNHKKANAYLYAAAICHQTHNLKNETHNLIGWNYVEDVFRKLAESGHEMLDFQFIEKTDVSSLSNMLESLFPRNSDSDETSLEHALDRAELIKNAVSKLNKMGYKSAIDLTNKSKGQVKSGEFALYKTLSSLRAFEDPYRKKSTLFIKLMYQSGLLKELNVNDLEPLMDYHMQRLLLRTGCVTINESDLSVKLKKRQQIESDDEVRSKCIDAIRKISESSGVSLLDLDDIFWAIGRSCCNQHILCTSGKCDKTPCTVTTIVDIPHQHKCMLKNGCKGFVDPSLRDFWEPQVKTDFY